MFAHVPCMLCDDDMHIPHLALGQLATHTRGQR